ncbi:MAG: hypothetical protein SH819_01695 [Cytophagales bacterium]|nr:hypothetical protein [Cytophagales bacterium]
MKLVILLLAFLLLGACSGSKNSHTVRVKKPIYHHTWYKNSRWHKKIHVGRIHFRLFEKQGVRTVKMKG